MRAGISRYRTVWVSLWLVALCGFVLSGTMMASFHGDESMQIYASHDYATAFIYKEPQRLTTSPPYYIDSDPHLRILNGSVNRYAIGLTWQLGGLTNGDLPTLWDWGVDYATNVERGHRPTDAMLAAGRLSSAVFLALSVIVMYGIGYQFGGILIALFVSTLYAINPVLLLNGRRAMQEGSFLFFGLLVILIALIIARKREIRPRLLPLWWIGLIITGGLTLASKHSGIVFVASALGWIVATELLRRNLIQMIAVSLQAVPAGFLIVVLFIALSPALWNDPLARLGDLIAEREKLIDIQVTSDPLAPTSLGDRLAGIVTQPFIMPVAHFEVFDWAKGTPVETEINTYMASPLSGLLAGWLIGLPLTLLAGLGLLSALVPRLRPYPSVSMAVGLLIWFAVTAASLMANPLPWQRYSLPLIPVAILLTGLGLQTLVYLVQQRTRSVPQSLAEAPILKHN